MSTVHFVCLGNVFRSRIAQAITRSRGVEATSSGVYADADRTANAGNEARVRQYLEARGLSRFAAPRATQLTAEALAGADVVVCMNRRVAEAARGLVELPPGARVWEIADNGEAGPPVTGERELRVFIAETAGRIERCCDDLVEELGFAVPGA